MTRRVRSRETRETEEGSTTKDSAMLGGGTEVLSAVSRLSPLEKEGRTMKDSSIAGAAPEPTFARVPALRSSDAAPSSGEPSRSSTDWHAWHRNRRCAPVWPRPTSAEGDVATDALISAGFSRRASARASRCELCQARYPATFISRGRTYGDGVRERIFRVVLTRTLRRAHRPARRPNRRVPCWRFAPRVSRRSLRDPTPRVARRGLGLSPFARSQSR